MAARRLSAEDLLAPTAALLILAVGCAPAPEWKDVPSAREHVATGLTFPDQIDGLQRAPIAPPSPSTGEVDISYASEGATRLRITLTPLPKGEEPDLQGALKERIPNRTASPRPRYEPPAPVFPVLCNSEEVTFAYRTLARTPGGSVEPTSVSSRNRTVVITSSGSVEPETGYVGPIDRWFAAELSGHLVVIESQIGRRAGHYRGADQALRDLLDPLGWPCRLPVPKLEEAAQRKGELETRRRTPPDRSRQRSAGTLLARTGPVGAFDEGSTLGPRPVHRDTAPGTYAHARSTGLPHTCETSAPSLFGEREEYVAYVEGDDFIASGMSMHFARVNGIGYAWSDEPLDERVVLLGRIRLQVYEDAYERLMHHPPPRWEDTFTFVEPADYDTCTPAEPQKIAVPDRELRDVTEDVIARRRQYFEASVETLQKLPFTPRLPHPSLIDLFPATRGHAGPTGYSVQYLAHGAVPEGESSQISIGFRAHTSDAPASQCGRARAGRSSCEHLMTTNRGVEVFRDLRFAGSSSSNPRLPHYHAKCGDASVHLTYIHWHRGGPSGSTDWRAHEFAAGELAAIFDSLQTVGAENVVRFPGMSVSQ